MFPSTAPPIWLYTICETNPKAFYSINILCITMIFCGFLTNAIQFYSSSKSSSGRDRDRHNHSSSKDKHKHNSSSSSRDKKRSRDDSRDDHRSSKKSR